MDEEEKESQSVKLKKEKKTKNQKDEEQTKWKQGQMYKLNSSSPARSRHLDIFWTSQPRLAMKKSDSISKMSLR